MGIVKDQLKPIPEDSDINDFDCNTHYPGLHLNRWRLKRLWPKYQYNAFESENSEEMVWDHEKAWFYGDGVGEMEWQ